MIKKVPTNGRRIHPGPSHADPMAFHNLSRVLRCEQRPEPCGLGPLVHSRTRPLQQTQQEKIILLLIALCVACSASKGFPRVPCQASAHPLTLPGPPRPPPLTPRSPLPRIAALLHPSLTPWGHHEAYFSAQQPEPQAHSRFSCSHGDQERPQGDQPPSRQGPQAAGSLSQSLPAFPTRFPCRTSAFRATTAC